MKKILFIENDPSRRELIRAAFGTKDRSVVLLFVPSRSEALVAAGRERPGLVFFKSEPEDDGDFVRKLAEAAAYVLPVLVTDRMDEQAVLRALKAGVIDCVGADASAIEDFPAVADRAIARYEALIVVSGKREPARTGSTPNSGDAAAEIARLKDLLYHSSALAAVGSLVSGIIHEINNPLTGTLAYTELLSMQVSDENVKAELAKILRSAERCKKIVDGLLAFSRPRATEKTVISINSIIEQTVELRRHALRSENIDIVTDFGATGAIFVHVHQIQRALLYIILNAEEATVSSGRMPRRISFTTRENRDDRAVTVQVADTGPGLDPSAISGIFDPFFTTKPGKCGLGLSLARDIVASHGGSIKAENAEAGALITIVLPTGA